MWRTAAGIIVGLIAWMVIVTLLNFGLRLMLPGYQSAEPSMQFTLAMKIGRLSIAALTSLAAGALIRVTAPPSRWAPWIVGLVLLVLFVPQHIHLWNDFPLWYHLTFLATLAPLVALGAALWPQRRSSASEAAGVNE